MGAQRAAKSGRDIVAYFAGHLANLANGNDTLGDAEEIVVVKPFHLYERVRRLLTVNKRYSEGLVGVWAYPPPDGVEEAAEFYFDRVLDRPIAARRDEPTSADNLAALVATRAAGPIAPPPRDEALSTWKALVGGPARRRRFRETSELFELSNRILKCLDAANRPYAETLRLGLCPKEWLVGDDAAGVNTLKAANGFLKALKAKMGDKLGRRPSEAEIEAAFAAAPVPGAKTGKDFVATPLGAAILSRVAGQDQTYLAVVRIGRGDPGRRDRRRGGRAADDPAGGRALSQRGGRGGRDRPARARPAGGDHGGADARRGARREPVPAPPGESRFRRRPRRLR